MANVSMNQASTPKHQYTPNIITSEQGLTTPDVKIRLGLKDKRRY